MENKKYILIWGAVFILLVSYLISLKYSKRVDLVKKDDTKETVVDLGNGIKAVGKGDFKVEQVNTLKNMDHPDLNREIMWAKDINEETKELLKSKIDETRVSLANDPTVVSNWLDLGVYYKMAGDFDGAVMYFKYILEYSPSDMNALLNISDIYSYHIKDIDKGISYYQKAIGFYPKNPEIYIKLSDVYLTILSDKNKALEIINKGLSIMPENQMLLSAKEKIK